MCCQTRIRCGLFVYLFLLITPHSFGQEAGDKVFLKEDVELTTDEGETVRASMGDRLAVSSVENDTLRVGRQTDTGRWDFFDVKREAVLSIDEAVDYFSALIRKSPIEGKYYRSRADALWWKGETSASLSDYSEAIRLNPKDALAFEGRARVQGRMKKREAAFADLSEAIRINPDLYWAYRNRASLHERKGDYDEAIKDLSEAIRLTPQALLYGRRARNHERVDNVQKALEDYAEAIELDPQDVDFYLRRSELYARQGDTARAVADVDEALRIDPENAEARRRRARYAKGSEPKTLKALMAKLDGGFWTDDDDPEGPITRLSLHDWEGADDALGALSQLGLLADLRELDLTGAGITDAGLKYVERFSRLEDLNLTGTMVSDEGLSRLKNMKSLRRLEVDVLRASPRTVEELKRALPDATVRNPTYGYGVELYAKTGEDFTCLLRGEIGTYPLVVGKRSDRATLLGKWEIEKQWFVHTLVDVLRKKNGKYPSPEEMKKIEASLEGFSFALEFRDDGTVVGEYTGPEAFEGAFKNLGLNGRWVITKAMGRAVYLRTEVKGETRKDTLLFSGDSQFVIRDPRVPLYSDESGASMPFRRASGARLDALPEMLIDATAAEESAIAEIEEEGGSVYFDWSRPGRPVVAVTFVRVPVSDAILRQVGMFPGLEFFAAVGTRVTGAGFVHLRELKNLKKLIVASSPVTDDALSHLSGLSSLEVLCLEDTNVSDIKHLRRLSNLNALCLGGAKMTNQGLRFVSELQNLEDLCVANNPTITDAALPLLQRIREHVDVNWMHCGISELGLLWSVKQGNPEEWRTFTDHTGRYLFEATWYRIDGPKVTLLKKDEPTPVTIEMEKLSRADREWIRRAVEERQNQRKSR